MSNTQQLMQTLGDRIAAQASAKRVYGEPVTVEGRTVIPVAKVRFGFGAGSKGAEGGGGGGGSNAAPVGALEITAAGTRFIHFQPWRPMALAAAAGFVVGVLVARRR